MPTKTSNKVKTVHIRRNDGTVSSKRNLETIVASISGYQIDSIATYLTTQRCYKHTIEFVSRDKSQEVAIQDEISEKFFSRYKKTMSPEDYLPIYRKVVEEVVHDHYLEFMKQ